MTRLRSFVRGSSFRVEAAKEAALKILEMTAGQIATDAATALTGFDEQAEWISQREFSRAVVLASAPLLAVLPETYLGLRHGPMSFLREDTLVLGPLSSTPAIRRYELDLVKELSAKRLGYFLLITPAKVDFLPVNQQIRAIAPDLPDRLRTPFEIVFPQLLAFHLCLRAGLDPDNLSPAGIINRVVQGFQIYED